MSDNQFSANEPKAKFYQTWWFWTIVFWPYAIYKFGIPKFRSLNPKAQIGVGLAFLALFVAMYFSGADKRAQEAEVTRLGFDSTYEMRDVQTKGWHTKSQYIADETARATRMGFASADELHNAEKAGYTDKAAYDQYKAAEAAQEATRQEQERAQLDAQKATTPPSSDSSPSQPSVGINDANALDKEYGTKAQVTCSDGADDYLRSIAKHDFAWDDDAKGFFGVKFPEIRKHIDTPGVVTYVTEKAKLQDGFGAWNHITLLCHYNTQTDKATFDNE